MLGKLMKYDMKYMARVLPWIYLGAVAVSLVISLFGALSAYSGSEALLVFSVLGVMPLYLLIAAISVCSTIFMMIRIYKNMFADEGYLTFTLPVKTSSVVWSKLLTGAVWNFVGGAVTLAVILLPVTIILSAYASVDPGFASEIALVFDSFGELSDILPQLGLLRTVIVSVLSLIVALFSGKALFMLSCCLAQRLNKNRGMAAVGIYLGFNFLHTIINSAATRVAVSPFVFGSMFTEDMDVYVSTITDKMSATSFSASLSSLLISAAVTVLSIFFSCRIVKNKLNMI